ncbi:HU family DNA-binding protein [Rhodopirellula sp. MGV]|uniref:HU family DNA-binding protein n=1 Tax=Rhodopirellula sp. MGV TaxID=2023130 RepID=UPI000B9648D1|nr:HU family DNA-binding protein [Rhodopirellula sp. MGV]OYP32348.1 integration host factor subunit beta [Rhodopirellula sp. MGV]PNY35867.1 integration host factor subunit beta [Rhodopirellula baltica]
MTKKDIVRTISDEVGLTQQQTKKIVQRTFDSIIDTLVRDGRIELRNFGVFEVKPRAARRARNPRTGDEVIVPEKHVVTFKPGKYMEARVQEADLEGQEPLGSSDEITQTHFGATDNSNKISGRWDED